jgi:acetyl esterase/lipase
MIAQDINASSKPLLAKNFQVVPIEICKLFLILNEPSILKVMRFVFFVIPFFMSFLLLAQRQIPLFEGRIINSKPSLDEETIKVTEGITIVSKISRPSLTLYLPKSERDSRAAVIICPGGGYWVNAISHEGTDVAKRFSKQGVVAFVLKYRIPNDETMIDREIGALQDLQQAIKVVREGASQWNVDPGKIGVLGFSAGGHLASTAGTHFSKSYIENKNNVSLRPDYMVLIYPVISFTDSINSREQLIGKNPSMEKITSYSNELQVTDQTPPTFLVHASDDDGVSPEHSIRFYQSLVRNKVKAELHLYQSGGHGFGLNNPTTDDQWFDRCIAWLKSNRWIDIK